MPTWTHTKENEAVYQSKAYKWPQIINHTKFERKENSTKYYLILITFELFYKLH